MTRCQVSGFSLHAGVAAKAHQRRKLERLCRYISRPAVSEKRLSLTPNGNIRYRLKTPYRDGTTHVILEPLDFIARLAALVPKPRVNLTRFHGVFGPNSRDRAAVTPAKRGKGAKPAGLEEEQEKTPAQRRAGMTWAQRLKRELNRFRSTVRISDSTVGHDGGSVIIQEWRKPGVMSLPFPSGVAKTIYLGKGGHACNGSGAASRSRPDERQVQDAQQPFVAGPRRDRCRPTRDTRLVGLVRFLDAPGLPAQSLRAPRRSTCNGLPLRGRQG